MRVYKGARYYNCDGCTEEEMEALHVKKVHVELCECGFEMKLSADPSLRWVCRSCGNSRLITLELLKEMK